MKPWMFGQRTKSILEFFGQEIRRKRKLRMITAAKLSHDAGIARSTLILIEKGAPGVGMGSYINVMIALGMERRLLEFILNDPHHPALRKFRYPKFDD